MKSGDTGTLPPPPGASAPLTGADTVTYAIQLTPEQAGAVSEVRATLYYQAIPPYYLKHRVDGAEIGPNLSDTERLYYMMSHLDTSEVEHTLGAIEIERCRPTGNGPCFVPILTNQSPLNCGFDDPPVVRFHLLSFGKLGVGRFLEEDVDLLLRKDDRQDAVLVAIVVEDVGEARRDHAANAEIQERPGLVHVIGRVNSPRSKLTGIEIRSLTYKKVGDNWWLLLPSDLERLALANAGMFGLRKIQPLPTSTSNGEQVGDAKR